MNPRDFIIKAKREAPISLISAALSSVSQYYRVPEIRHLRQAIKELDIDCILDVGANEGQYARMLRRWAGFRGRIISFEPNPAVLKTLQKAAAGDSLWTVEPVALSSSDGTLSFNATSDTQFGSIEKPIEGETSYLQSHLAVAQTIEVECRTLTSEFERLQTQFGFQRPMLKMDTQGHDLSVFRSGAGIVDKFVMLQSELSFVPFYQQVPLYDETIKEYEGHGFALSAIFPNNRGSFPILREMDCLMVNKSAVR